MLGSRRDVLTLPRVSLVTSLMECPTYRRSGFWYKSEVLFKNSKNFIILIYKFWTLNNLISIKYGTFFMQSYCRCVPFQHRGIGQNMGSLRYRKTAQRKTPNFSQCFLVWYRMVAFVQQSLSQNRCSYFFCIALKQRGISGFKAPVRIIHFRICSLKVLTL